MCVSGANAFLTAVNTLAQISFKEYPGSGYVVDLGTDPTEANTKLNELFTGGYFDKYTRGELRLSLLGPLCLTI